MSSFSCACNWDDILRRKLVCMETCKNIEENLIISKQYVKTSLFLLLLIQIGKVKHKINVLLFFLSLSLSLSLSLYIYIYIYIYLNLTCPSPGYYGKNCSLKCPQDCHDGYCDSMEGTCLGCKLGFFGPICNMGKCFLYTVVCRYHQNR